MTDNERTIQFSDEMNQLIRAIVELSNKEGVSISSISNEMHNLNQMQIADNIVLSEFEKKLYNMFIVHSDRRSAIKGVKRKAVLCAIYYDGRKQGRFLSLGEISKIASERLGIAPKTVREKLKELAFYLSIFWLDYKNEKYPRASIESVLDTFYVKVMLKME